MEMTSEEKILINKTFYQITPISERASERFYDRLFEISDEARSLFGNTNMRAQRKKLIDMIAMVVYSLDNMDKVTKALEKMGTRHVEYGVKEEHWALVGEAFLWMLEQELSADYTPEVDAAWKKIYGIISDIAKKAAYPAAE